MSKALARRSWGSDNLELTEFGLDRSRFAQRYRVASIDRPRLDRTADATVGAVSTMNLVDLRAAIEAIVA